MINQIFDAVRYAISSCLSAWTNNCTSHTAIAVRQRDIRFVQQCNDLLAVTEGASVLKMLANSIGEKTFLKGVWVLLDPLLDI